VQHKARHIVSVHVSIRMLTKKLKATEFSLQFSVHVANGAVTDSAILRLRSHLVNLCQHDWYRWL